MLTLILSTEESNLIPRRAALFVTAVSTLLVLTGCGGGETDAGVSEENPVVIYSGRSEELVGPLLSQLEEAVGAPVEVRYADSAELAAQLLEEGTRTEADVFFSQDAGALGALARADMLAELPASVTDRVDPAYVDVGGRWVATSARARVVIYNQDFAPEVTEFTGIDDILDEKSPARLVMPRPTPASSPSSLHCALSAAKKLPRPGSRSLPRLNRWLMKRTQLSWKRLTAARWPRRAVAVSGDTAPDGDVRRVVPALGRWLGARIGVALDPAIGGNREFVGAASGAGAYADYFAVGRAWGGCRSCASGVDMYEGTSRHAVASSYGNVHVGYRTVDPHVCPGLWRGGALRRALSDVCSHPDSAAHPNILA